MQLYVPEIGTKLKLLEDWTFDLYFEYRNEKVLKSLALPLTWTEEQEKIFYTYYGKHSMKLPTNTSQFGVGDFACMMAVQYHVFDYSKDYVYPSVSTTLPAGTELIVDRIYIRKGKSDYSSITFRAKIGEKSQRFWAKLDDCNRIEFE